MSAGVESKSVRPQTSKDWETFLRSVVKTVVFQTFHKLLAVVEQAVWYQLLSYLIQSHSARP